MVINYQMWFSQHAPYYNFLYSFHYIVLGLYIYSALYFCFYSSLLPCLSSLSSSTPHLEVIPKSSATSDVCKWGVVPYLGRCLDLLDLSSGSQPPLAPSLGRNPA